MPAIIGVASDVPPVASAVMSGTERIGLPVRCATRVLVARALEHVGEPGALGRTAGRPALQSGSGPSRWPVSL